MPPTLSEFRRYHTRYRCTPTHTPHPHTPLTPLHTLPCAPTRDAMPRGGQYTAFNFWDHSWFTARATRVTFVPYYGDVSGRISENARLPRVALTWCSANTYRTRLSLLCLATPAATTLLPTACTTSPSALDIPPWFRTGRTSQNTGVHLALRDVSGTLRGAAARAAGCLFPV